MITSPTLPLAGQRVGASTGPGQFPRDNAGTVICQTTDRWGTKALVMMDSGKIQSCAGLTEVGIGWYVLEKAAPAAPKVAAFEVGKTYSTTGACDSDCVIAVTIASRTAKMIKTTDGKAFRIALWDETEIIRPWGRFSMSPTIRANGAK